MRFDTNDSPAYIVDKDGQHEIKPMQSGTTERDLVTEVEELLAKATPKRVAGSFEFYEKTRHGWICKTCGGEIKAVWKHAPIWDGPFPCSGSGEVTTWQEPFCPNCEIEP